MATIRAMASVFLFCAVCAITNASETVPQWVALRLAGDFAAAEELVTKKLQDPAVSTADSIIFYLELAKTYDRIGLHNNTRPVERALAQIKRAEKLSKKEGPRLRGLVYAEYASYHYRAGFALRDFSVARDYAEKAIKLLVAAGEIRAQSDAVHRLGLVNLQERNLIRARTLFDESLQLDERAGQRDWMLGEYYRHVGFVEDLSGNLEVAIDHYRKSLYFRQKVGANDAALFAEITLGSAYGESGNADLAQRHLNNALKIAQKINSPVGTARSAIALGNTYAAIGDIRNAQKHFAICIKSAESVNYESLQKRARDALAKLTH